MQRASLALTHEDRQKISRTIAEAESKTAAEIVPVVATSSGRYDRAEDIVGLWFGIAGLALAWTIWPQSIVEHGSWGSLPAWIHFAFLAAAVLIGFLVGAFLASRIGAIRRLFTPISMLREEVQSQARRVFFDTRIHHTDGRSGLLIYVSLFEHQAVVLADAAIVERLGQPQLDAICSELTTGIRASDLTTALCTAITVAGEKLSTSLPRQSDDVNELSDAVIILDNPL